LYYSSYICAGARPAELDHIKATSKTKSDAVYADVFKSYKSWVSDYKNPFTDGLFADDVGGIQPHLAVFKDGDMIRGLVRSTVQRVRSFQSCRFCQSFCFAEFN